MKRAVMVGAMFLALMVSQGAPAAAGNEWCSQDPVIQLLGAQFDLTTSVNASAWAVDGVSYRIEVPANATDAVAHYAQGLRLPGSVTFVPSLDAYDGSSPTFTVRVTVLVSAETDAAVAVDVTGRSVSAARVPGSTGEPVSFTIVIAAK